MRLPLHPPSVAAQGRLLLLLLSALLALDAAPAAAAAHDDEVAMLPFGETAVADRHLGARCGSCHLAGEDVTPENARRLVTTQRRICSRCHEGVVEASHPSGVTPRHRIPAAFPLDWKGQVTCSTCHVIHDPDPGRLRGPASRRAFCTSCHPARFFDRMADGGQSLLGFGHLDAGKRRRTGGIDAYSQRCIECHGREATLAGRVARTAFSAANGTGMANHPIGMEYRRADFRRGLRPPSALPREILLPEGRVSCLSCHRGYSAEHGAPVAIRERDICQTCHEM